MPGGLGYPGPALFRICHGPLTGDFESADRDSARKAKICNLVINNTGRALDFRGDVAGIRTFRTITTPG